MLLNVQLQIRRSTLKQLVRRVLHLLAYIRFLTGVTRELVTYKALQRY